MIKSPVINKEYEARAMISEAQYIDIYNHFSSLKRRKFYLENTNIYFDTPKHDIINSGMVLRLRNINNKEYELTLKIKDVNFDKEINLQISKSHYNSLLNDFKLSKGEIKEELIKRNIDTETIKKITTLTTHRLEVFFTKYILVIDKNFYSNIVDYDVEVESTSRESAKKYLESKLAPFGVTYKKGYISKSRRAFLSL